MKKLILFVMLCYPAMLAAQGNGVTVSNLVVSAGSPSTVTFNVSWENTGDMPTPWSDTAWVFVEYNNNGVIERLPVTGATASAGTVMKVPNNDKGVWVVGNARDADTFSATVKLLTATADLAGACAYASNYPPVGEYTSATEISFTGTPEYKVVLERSDKSTYTATVGKDESLPIPNGEAVLSFTDKTGAPGKLGCIPSKVYDLNVSASSFCVGVGVTFALSGTEDGRNYELYRDGTPAAVATLMGNENAAAFSGTFDVAGVYTAASVADGVYCAQSMTGAHTIAAYPAFTAGEITSAATTTKAGTNPNVTIVNATPASGGDGSITYQWRRTGTSSATLTGSNATYTFSSDAAGNYGMVGMYYFNRYAKDSACSITWVAAFGTYTLTVAAGGDSQPQGSCTYTEPAVVGTFAAFPNNYSGGTYVSLTDERDNKNYPVLKMGGRWIMARNLNYQKNMTFQSTSGSPATNNPCTACIGSYWCPGSGTSSTNTLSCDVYGALYTWETAMVLDGVGTWVTTDDKYNTLASAGTYNHGRATANGATGSGRGICPEHWHVPTDAEWGLFLDAVEGSGSSHTNVSGNAWVGVNAGKYSKAACNGSATDSAPLWTIYESTKGTDTYDFRLLPAGRRLGDGSYFIELGGYSRFWSSSTSGSSPAWHRTFAYNNAGVEHFSLNRSEGVSVRCIRD